MNTATKLHHSPIKAEFLDGSLNGYQKAAITTAIYPGQGTYNGLIYTTLKLNGEAGEMAEKVGKLMRDDNCVLTEEKKKAMAYELGDVFWYIAASAKELGYSLEEIANLNISKLKERQQKGTLGGSGDNR